MLGKILFFKALFFKSQWQILPDNLPIGNFYIKVRISREKYPNGLIA